LYALLKFELRSTLRFAYIFIVVAVETIVLLQAKDINRP